MFIDGIAYQLTAKKPQRIVFIHADTLDRRLWTDQVEHFAPNYQVLTYDLRGFGQSIEPIDSFTHHEDVYRLMQSLDLPSAHFVGLSYGGEIATNFAITYPKLVKTLTLVSSSLNGFKSTVDWPVAQPRLTLEQMKAAWLNHPVFASLHEHPQAREKVVTMIADYKGSKWLHPDLAQGLKPPASTQLETLSMPVCVMTGGKDLAYFAQIKQYFSQHVRNLTHIHFPQNGHLINVENPTLFNQKLTLFLNSHSHNSKL